MVASTCHKCLGWVTACSVKGTSLGHHQHCTEWFISRQLPEPRAKPRCESRGLQARGEHRPRARHRLFSQEYNQHCFVIHGLNQ